MASVTAAQRVRPFIGRETELRALSDLLRGDEPWVACLHGIAGVGKSGLVRAFLERARGEDSTVLLLDCRTVEPTERGFLAAAGGFGDVEAFVRHVRGRCAAGRARPRPLRGVPPHGHLVAAGARPGPAGGRRPPARRSRAAPRSLVRARAVPHPPARPARGRRRIVGARAPRDPRGRRRAPQPDRTRTSAGADARIGRRLRAPRAGDRGRGDDAGGRGADAALPRGCGRPGHAPRARGGIARAPGHRAAARSHDWEADGDEALRRLLALPFVDGGRDGLIVHESVRDAVAGFLRANEPDALPPRPPRRVARAARRDPGSRADGTVALHRRHALPDRQPGRPRGVLPDRHPAAVGRTGRGRATARSSRRLPGGTKGRPPQH